MSHQKEELPQTDPAELAKAVLEDLTGRVVRFETNEGLKNPYSYHPGAEEVPIADYQRFGVADPGKDGGIIIEGKVEKTDYAPQYFKREGQEAVVLSNATVGGNVDQSLYKYGPLWLGAHYELIRPDTIQPMDEPGLHEKLAA